MMIQYGNSSDDFCPCAGKYDMWARAFISNTERIRDIFYYQLAYPSYFDKVA